MIDLSMFGIGGLSGTILLGYLLDVYDKVFTLRMAVLSAIGLSLSYGVSILYD